ncbi:MAG: hypothetical protein IJG53_00575 [Eggerthellaceae bacterium]|nr:hypothetical protein [Eggerthellaceae bacterium]
MAIDPKEFVEALRAQGLDFFAGVPDSLLKNLCACIFANTPPERNIIAANEGNAIGMACGYTWPPGARAWCTCRIPARAMR